MLKKKNCLQIKLFLRSFLMFLAVSACFTVSFSTNSNAQQGNIYLVEGIVAKAFADSSGEAKVQATTSAEKDAFTTLLSRLSLDTIIADDVSDDDLFDMVDSKQITKERISGNSYFAIFNITFSRNAVERVLKEKNVRRREVPDETYLLIPVKVLKQDPFEANTQNKFLLWEDDNDWKTVIEKEIRKKSMLQFIVPESDLSNITSLNKDNIEQISFDELEPLFSKYRSSEGLVMFFSYDNIENKVTILVQDIRKLQKKTIKLSFVNVNRLNYESLINKVAEKTLSYLLTLKQNSNLKPDKNLVRIEIPISNLDDWIMIKNKIESSDLVNQLNIESLSKDYAKISIHYEEGQEDIIDAFAEKNIILTRKSDNLFSLTVLQF